ncbi:BACON domain-containing protein [Sphingobacterium psychroaquaticum]|nr:BACON domain-containing protein [Sphingobacterium psychroaquaticum]
MKSINYSINRCIVWLLIGLCGLSSCSKDELLNLFQRQSDGLNFEYLANSKDFAIKSSGSWSASSSTDWITVSPASGEGKGASEQQVQIQVQQNTGNAREGKVNITQGGKSFDVLITQDEGNLVFDKPIVASSFLINQAVDGQMLQLPYQKGASSDQVDLKFELEGPGSKGLKIGEPQSTNLVAGNATINIPLVGVPTQTGEIQIKINLEVASRGLKNSFIVKSRVKVDGGLDPLESPTVTLVKVLPRMAVLDWGKYIKNSGVSRTFELELATSQYGPAIRRYANQVNWLSSTSIGTGSYFFDFNRFAFAALTPNTTYWFRIVHKTVNSNNVDSDVSYFQFSTPREEVLGSNVVLYKDFDDFWWGGSPIYQAFGVQPIEADIRAGMDPRSDVIKGTDIRTNSWNNNLANAFAGNLGPTGAPVLWDAYWDGAKYGKNLTAADYAGWNGENAFPFTGGIRLASASATGNLRTAKLDKLGDVPANILITTNTAAYFEPYHNWGEDFLKHYIQIEGDGKITDAGATGVIDSDKQASVTMKSNVDPVTKGPLYQTTIPTQHQVKVSGATKNTRVVIRTYPYSGSAHYRIWVDDIKVEQY